MKSKAGIGQLAAATIVVLAPAVVAGVGLLLGGDVPDPLPMHWNLAGEVDRTTSLAAFTIGVGIAVALAAAAGLILAAGARRGMAWVAGAAAASWVAWLVAVLHAATLGAASGAASAAEADLPLVTVLALMAVPVGAALLVYRVLPWASPRDLHGPAPNSPLELRAGERVVWVGGASSRRLLVLALVLAVLALPLWFAVWPAAVVTTLAALAVGWAHCVTARVDHDQVTVSWGPALWPRIRIDMDDIASADAEHIEPLRWGGWGYRRTLRGRAAVVRRGPGLVLVLHSGQRFAVTVDHPEGAADLVNAVLVRAAR